MQFNKKNIISFLITMVIIINLFTVHIYANTTDIKIDSLDNLSEYLKGNIMLMVGSHEAIVNKERTVIDSENELIRPINMEGHILVPVRFIAKAIGVNISWDSSSNSISMSIGGKQIKARIGEKILTIDGKEIQLEASTQMVENKAYMPLQAIAHTLDKMVFWDERGLIMIGDKVFQKETDSLLIEKAITLFGLYVSSNGSDSAAGTMNAPFQTVEKARDAIRKIKRSSGLPIGGITVYIRGGEYAVSKSFELSGLDSGSKDAPIVYRNYPGEEISFSGGVAVEGKSAKKVTEKSILSLLPPEVAGKVYQIDLKSQRINHYGSITKVNFGSPNTATVMAMPPLSGPELFYDDKIQTLARYPNFTYNHVGKVLDGGPNLSSGEANSRGVTYEYEDNRPQRWVNADDAWVDGYFAVNWAQETMKVKEIDVKNNSIATASGALFGITKGQRYFTYNLLEEIDVPGEYYIDRSSGMLYIYPPSDITKAKLRLSMLEDPVISIKNASDITIKGLTIENARGYGVKLDNTQNCKIIHCEIRNLGSVGVTINEGTDNGVIGCSIHDIGMGGVIISAGDRKTLTPGNNYVENCDIFYYSRIKRTMTTGVSLYGVGNRASNNAIHDAPHMAIFFTGNDHIMEKNEIYNVLQETDDAGAIYTGREWSFRGIIIRNNFIHDLKLGTGGGHVYGIYLDDMMSGIQVYGNVIYKVDCAMIYGGGHDNIITNNLVVDCPNNVIFDNRAENWARKSVVEGGEMWSMLNEMPWQSAIWQKRYPEINLLFTSGKFAGIPQRNVMKNNIFINGEKLQIFQGVIDNGTFQNNIHTDKSLEFKNLEKLNLNLPADSKLYTLLPEFQPIEFDKIGLQINQDRSGYPVLNGNFKTIAPQNGEKNVDGRTITFMWEKCKGADSYRLIVAKDENFENIVVDEIVSTTNYKTGGFKYNNTKYYWKVEARSNGRTMLGEDNQNGNGIATFTTKKYEIPDITELAALIQSLGSSFESATEGEQPGNYMLGSKAKIRAALDEAKAVLDDKSAKQKNLDLQVKKILAATNEFNQSLVNTTSGIEEMMDSTKWSAPADLTSKDKALIYGKPTAATNTFIGRKIGANELLEFKLKTNLTTWQALSVNTQKWGVNLWETPNYSIVIKRDIFELQRYDESGSGLIIKTYPNNDVVVDGEWCDVVFGAVNTFNGVNIILKVNGKEVINYYDTDASAMKKDGYFMLTNASAGAVPEAQLMIAPKN